MAASLVLEQNYPNSSEIIMEDVDEIVVAYV